MTFFLSVYQWDSILPKVGRTFDIKIGGITKRYTWAGWVITILLVEMSRSKARQILNILNM